MVSTIIMFSIFLAQLTSQFPGREQYPCSLPALASSVSRDNNIILVSVHIHRTVPVNTIFFM